MALTVVGVVLRDTDTGEETLAYYPDSLPAAVPAPEPVPDPVPDPEPVPEPVPEPTPEPEPPPAGERAPFRADPAFDPSALPDEAQGWLAAFWDTYQERYIDDANASAASADTYKMRALKNLIMAMSQVLWATGDPTAWAEIDRLMQVVRANVGYWGDDFLCIPSHAPGTPSPTTRSSLNDHLFFGLAAMAAYMYRANGDEANAQYWLDYCLNEHMGKWLAHLGDSIDRSAWAKPYPHRISVMLNASQTHPMHSVMTGFLILGHMTNDAELTKWGQHLMGIWQSMTAGGAGWMDRFPGFGHEPTEYHHIGYGGSFSPQGLFLWMASIPPFESGMWLLDTMQTWRDNVWAKTDPDARQTVKDVAGQGFPNGKYADLLQNAQAGFMLVDDTTIIADVAARVWAGAEWPHIPAALCARAARGG